MLIIYYHIVICYCPYLFFCSGPRGARAWTGANLTKIRNNNDNDNDNNNNNNNDYNDNDNNNDY